jgi:hypothetical protein
MLSAYSKNKDAAAKLIKYLVSLETQKEHAIKVSRLPTLPAVYKDKDVLAAQPWFARLQPVFENAVARPSTGKGTDGSEFRKPRKCAINAASKLAEATFEIHFSILLAVACASRNDRIKLAAPGTVSICFCRTFRSLPTLTNTASEINRSNQLAPLSWRPFSTFLGQGGRYITRPI